MGRLYVIRVGRLEFSKRISKVASLFIRQVRVFYNLGCKFYVLFFSETVSAIAPTANKTLPLFSLLPNSKQPQTLWLISFWPKSHFGQSHFGQNLFLDKYILAMGLFGHRTFWPWDYLATGHFGHGTIWPWDYLAMGLFGHGTFWPRDDLATGHFGHRTF